MKFLFLFSLLLMLIGCGNQTDNNSTQEKDTEDEEAVQTASNFEEKETVKRVLTEEDKRFIELLNNANL